MLNLKLKSLKLPKIFPPTQSIAIHVSFSEYLELNFSEWKSVPIHDNVARLCVHVAAHSPALHLFFRLLLLQDNSWIFDETLENVNELRKVKCMKPKFSR